MLMIVCGTPEDSPMGTPSAVAELINAAITNRGLETSYTDEQSGVLLHDGVEALTYSERDGQVVAIAVDRPTGEMIELLGELGATRGWQLLDAGTGEPV